jgi:hypothetical protein
MSVDVNSLVFDPRKRADPNLTLPDLSDAVIGWRAWKCSTEVPPYGVSPKLLSVTHGNYYWTPHRAAIADCSRCTPDELPGEVCSCGFYSAKSARHLLQMAYHPYDADQGEVTIIGKVANWGKVIEGGQGWRAQMSYPVQLYVPFECSHLAKPLAKGYGCKVTLRNFLTSEAR